MAEIAEHGLDGGEATAVLLATFVAVDACDWRELMMPCEYASGIAFNNIEGACAGAPVSWLR